MTVARTKPWIGVRVRSITYEAEGINSYELVDPEGGDLPTFSAGAHIDIALKDGLVRQYSLCNDPRERRHYRIAVLREAAGRGGSEQMHQDVRVGDILSISEPRNNFPVEAAERHLLLAGGIGVTPMMAMIAELQARGADFTLRYCTRSPARTAFLSQLAPLVASGRVLLHHDDGVPEKGLDMAKLLEEHQPGTHLYYCGPAGFMEAATAASAHWPPGTVHREYFSAPDELAAQAHGGRAFQVKIASTGDIFDVPPDKSIVDVLREQGFFIDTSCEEGYCGTCMTRYVEGEPEHRDVVLDEEDRSQYALICCARSKSPLLVLDL